MSEAPRPPRSVKIRLRWNVLIPVGLLALATMGLIWLAVASSGEAEPPPLMGSVGTPVRGTFVPPTPTPTGQRPTPRPRPTLGPQVPGTPEERDGQRQQDLLKLVAAITAYNEDQGAYPTTGGNIQTLCVYQELDAGCALGEYYDGEELPSDPLGEAAINGYWYQSDGETSAKVYVSFEQDIDQPRCETDYVEFEDLPNLVCPEVR